MSLVAKPAKPKLKPSTFQTLWSKASNLKRKNRELATRLDKLVTQIDKVITPKEHALLRSQIPLVTKLLDLGQRKSMTNWERETLHLWIRELVEPLYRFGLVDTEIKNSMARYDAFNLGINLEDDSKAAHEELTEKQHQRETERAAAAEKHFDEMRQHYEKHRDALLKEAEREIERELDNLLGADPLTNKEAHTTIDMWAEELDDELSAQSKVYKEKRASLKAELMAEALSEIEDLFGDYADEDIEPWDDEFSSEFEFSRSDKTDYPHDSKNNKAEALSNEVFQKLFRATAGKLHPDRESDPEVRLEKQRLMTNLLKARKKFDIITILEMYETYVGQHTGFSSDDQQALTASLEKMLQELEGETEKIIYQSPKHAMAYQVFYNKDKKKVDAALQRRLHEIDGQSADTTVMIEEIRSLKTLKPWLEERNWLY